MIRNLARTLSLVSLFAFAAGCTDSADDFWGRDVTVAMVINNQGTSIVCRTDTTYSVYVADKHQSGGSVQRDDIKANQFFRIHVPADGFSVKHKANGSAWFPWRTYPTIDNTRTYTLGCVGGGSF